MTYTVFAFVLFYFSAAAYGTEKRQAQQVCDPFANIVNPCDKGSTSIEYHPHPTDHNKYLQCASGKMMVVECPSGENYIPDTQTCSLPRTDSSTLAPISATINNPCSAQNLVTTGKLYFTYPSDNSRFIQCNPDGTASIMPCPPHLVWNESRLSCVYAFDNSPAKTTVQTPIDTGLIRNPCIGKTIPLAGLFFSHADPNKFIQCDIAGDAYVLSCPLGLVWNEYSKTCLSPFLIQVATPSTTASSL